MADLADLAADSVMPKKLTANSKTPRMPLSLRTTPELREHLEARAVASGRALGQEVETLLERLVEREKVNSGQHNVRLAYLVELTAGAAEQGAQQHGQPHQRWTENKALAHYVFGRVVSALRTFMEIESDPQEPTHLQQYEARVLADALRGTEALEAAQAAVTRGIEDEKARCSASAGAKE